MIRTASGVCLVDDQSQLRQATGTPDTGDDGKLTHSHIAELSEAFRMLLYCGNAASGHHSAVINTDPSATMTATVSTMVHQHASPQPEVGSAGTPRSTSPPPSANSIPNSIGGHTGQGNATVVNSITTDQLSAILTSLGVAHAHTSATSSNRETTSPPPASPALKRNQSFKGNFNTDQSDAVSSTMRVIDDDFNGHISFTDFLVLMLRRASQSDIEEMKIAFRYFDKNNTGRVSTNQFVEMLATMGEQSSPEEIDEMLAFADPDMTGEIDYVSFLNNLGHST